MKATAIKTAHWLAILLQRANCRCTKPGLPRRSTRLKKGLISGPRGRSICSTWRPRQLALPDRSGEVERPIGAVEKATTMSNSPSTEIANNKVRKQT
jgi:hypothetical protein